ncbi:hypothetical protein DB346_05520 [Verrucomicrobia bacterium LW23]|nr:hypothetical protein DB346_05520 [Verrucomicrobia bacterium LW23]
MSSVTFNFPSITLNSPAVPSGDGVSGKINVDLVLAAMGFSAGTGIGQINRAFRKTYTLTGTGGGTPDEVIDLFDFGGPTVEDALGRPYELDYVKGIVVQVKSTEPTAKVTLGAEGSAAAWQGINGSDTVKIADVEAGTPFIWFSRAGKAVTDSTDHLLKIANQHASASVTVDVLILGSQ